MARAAPGRARTRRGSGGGLRARPARSAGSGSRRTHRARVSAIAVLDELPRVACTARSSSMKRRMSAGATSGPRPSPWSQNMICRISSRCSKASSGSAARPPVGQQPVDVRERGVHGGPDGRRQLRGQLVDLGRLAAHDEHSARAGRRAPSRPRARARGWPGADRPRRAARRTPPATTYTVPGRAAAGHRVDDDEAVARGEQLLGEPDPGGADLHHARRPGAGLALLQPADDLDAEAVVAPQHVAEPGHERAHGQASRSAGSTPTATRISSPSTATGKTASRSRPPSSRLPVRTS